MPQAKKSSSTRSTRSKGVPQPALSKAYESELSYETRVVVVILLLLFVYPIGLICMWAWMRNWPLWLKLLLSLPLFLGVLAFFVVMVALGSFLGHSRWNDRVERMQEKMHEQQELRLRPSEATPTETLTLTPSPTEETTPNTY
jgi:hypothetical protein